MLDLASTNRLTSFVRNIFAVPYRFMEVGLMFLLLEAPIVENSSSASFIPLQSFALSLFLQSGETLCGELLERGEGGRLHQAAM